MLSITKKYVGALLLSGIVIAYILLPLFFFVFHKVPPCVTFERGGVDGYCRSISGKIFHYRQCPTGPTVIDAGICLGPTIVEVGKYNQGADSWSFHILSPWFAADNKQVFWGFSLLACANLQSFRVTQSSVDPYIEIAEDNNFTFDSWEVEPKAEIPPGYIIGKDGQCSRQ